MNRPLSSVEMRELRGVSSRAEITPTSFTNTYNWADLKAAPLTLLERYFDVFVYVANWGTRLDGPATLATIDAEVPHDVAP